MRLGALALGLVALGLAAPWAHTRAASSARVFDAETVPHRQVGIVLGALAHPDGRPSGFLANRLALALELYRAGRVDKLLVSGSNDPADGRETDVMSAWLLDRGLPPGDLLVDSQGLDTWASCAGARERGITEAVLISQSYHLPRAITICRALGVDAAGVGDDDARRWAWPYWYGQFRELFANVKMELDLVFRTRPGS